jgi:hypothetical protein
MSYGRGFIQQHDTVGIPATMHFYGDLAIMLQESLLHTDIDTYCGGGVWEDVSMWILILGGYAALNRPERAWFVELLAKMGKERQFCGFKDIKAVMARVLYQEALEKPFEILLEEVEGLMPRWNQCTFVD